MSSLNRPSSSDEPEETTFRQLKDRLPDNAAALRNKAQRYADLGDRWLVSVGKAIMRSTDRVRVEADVVKESASKAADTTKNLGREVFDLVSKKAVKISIVRPGRGANGGAVRNTLQQVSNVIEAYANVIEALPEQKRIEFVEGVCSRVVDALETLAQEALDEPIDGVKKKEPSSLPGFGHGRAGASGVDVSVEDVDDDGDGRR